MIHKLYCCSSTSVVPYRNLALEERLFNDVQPGVCILYLWQNQRTVVIGRNQNARAQCRVDALSADGGHLARRLSGGGAVFHDLGNLNFTFLVRNEDYDLSRQLAVIAGAAAVYGLRAELSGRNDLLIDGRKFSGNAFYRSGDHRYHHGTLLADVDMAQMTRYLTPDASKLKAKGVDSVRSRVVNLRELCPAVTIEGLKEAMISAFGEVYGLSVEPLPEPEEALLAKSRERFASFDWLFGQERLFTLTTETVRFPWGCAQLCLTVEHGVVTDAALYTDAMEPELADIAERAVKGLSLAPGRAGEALMNAAKGCPELQTQLADLAAML